MRRIQDTNVGPGDTFISRDSGTNTPGTKIRKAHKNDAQEELCRAIESTGEAVDTTLYSVGDGNRDQTAQMVAHYSAGGAINYIEALGSAADIYKIEMPDLGIRQREKPQAFFDGMEIIFTTAFPNTGTSTIKVGDLPVKPLRDFSGFELKQPHIIPNQKYKGIYNLANDEVRLEILPLDLKSGRKNKSINGNFDIWQRGVSQTSSGYGSDDRWENINSGSTKSHTQQIFPLGQTDVPNNPRYFSRTVAASVAGVSNNVSKSQKIEGVKTFSGETIILSFWAKADAAKDISLDFAQNFGSGGAPSASVVAISPTTFAIDGDWKKLTVAVTIPSITGKTLGTGNNDYLELRFWFDAGSDFDARTNALGQQSGTFDIAQVQIEKGNVATDFECRSTGEELVLCQRYFERWDFAASMVLVTAQAFSATGVNGNIRFKEKRSAPSLSSGGNFIAMNASFVGAGGSISFSSSNLTHSRIAITAAAGLAAGNASGIFTNATTYIEIDSEL